MLARSIAQAIVTEKASETTTIGNHERSFSPSVGSSSTTDVARRLFFHVPVSQRFEGTIGNKARQVTDDTEPPRFGKNKEKGRKSYYFRRDNRRVGRKARSVVLSLGSRFPPVCVTVREGNCVKL